jgi:hypothetical protein
MLRWALRLKRDTRLSLLYILANSPSLQLLGKKSCLRFFQSLESTPRFASEFVNKVHQRIEHRLLGTSPIIWWQKVAAQYTTLTNTKPLYRRFKQVLLADIGESTRLAERGTTDILKDIARLCFAGEKWAPPADTREDLKLLVASESALVLEPDGDKPPVLAVHPWPSWLTRGSPKLLAFFIDIFYACETDTQDTCHLC